MAQQPDIRVRKGAGRLHRTSLALDRLREREGSTTLRVLVQANLPRGQTRPSRLQYQRVGSWLIDCRTPADVAHVREALANLMQQLSHPEKNEQLSPGEEAVAEASAAPEVAEEDPALQRVLQRIAEMRGQAPEGPGRVSSPLKPAPSTAEERGPWQRLRLV